MSKRGARRLTSRDRRPAPASARKSCRRGDTPRKETPNYPPPRQTLESRVHRQLDGLVAWGGRIRTYASRLKVVVPLSLSKKVPGHDRQQGSDSEMQRFESCNAYGLVASCCERLFALAGKRVRGQRDDWDVAGLRIALQPQRGFAAVHHGHFEVH